MTDSERPIGSERQDLTAALSEFIAAQSGLRRRLRATTELSDAAWTTMLVLSSAARHGATMSPKELATMLAIRSASVTTLVDKLVRRGLVDRAPSTVDRRGFALSLTPAGVAFVEQHDVGGRAEARIADDLSDDDARLVARFFTELTRAVETTATKTTTPTPGS
ncbi:MarR family winged helix-turn-helix transcriptional regulator [Herbiconiux liangxiaofengii]|uniref:MarR family winged helix-turn-helix transcriptional regulator n=1 Tax=Herbiconiux liangxiaofengii TaxID=3342795 RepID=UPI0035BB5F3E